MLQTLSRFFAVIIGIAVFIAAFMAYFIRTIDTNTRIVYDGLGRQLSEPPIWAKVLITSENSWAGFGWHALDIVCFFGGLALAFGLFSLGENDNK